MFSISNLPKILIVNFQGSFKMTDATLSSLLALGVLRANPAPGAIGQAGIFFDPGTGLITGAQNSAGASVPIGGGGSVATPVAFANPIVLTGNTTMGEVPVVGPLALSIASSPPSVDTAQTKITFIPNGTNIPTFPGTWVALPGSATYSQSNLMDLSIYNSSGVIQYGWIVSAAYTAPPVWTAESAPGGNVNTAYSYTFVATAAASYALASGTLPPGLTLTGGVLSGTPTTAAAYTFVIAATNTGGTVNSTTQNVTIAIALPVWTADTATTTGTIGNAYSYTFAATGATTYAIASGSLPAGVTLAPSTGVISGIPTTAAASTFTVSATNAGGTITSPSQTVTIAAASSTLAIVAGTPRSGALNLDTVTLGGISATDWYFVYGSGTTGIPYQKPSPPYTKGFAHSGTVSPNSSMGLTISSAAASITNLTAYNNTSALSAGNPVNMETTLTGFVPGVALTIEYLVGSYNSTAATFTASVADASASPVTVSISNNDTNQVYKVHFTPSENTVLTLNAVAPNTGGTEQVFGVLAIIYPGTL